MKARANLHNATQIDGPDPPNPSVTPHLRMTCIILYFIILRTLHLQWPLRPAIHPHLSSPLRTHALGLPPKKADSKNTQKHIPSIPVQDHFAQSPRTGSSARTRPLRSDPLGPEAEKPMPIQELVGPSVDPGVPRRLLGRIGVKKETVRPRTWDLVFVVSFRSEVVYISVQFFSLVVSRFSKGQSRTI